MSVYRTILVVCFVLFLSSCTATPVLTGYGDISREIKHEAPLVAKVDISPDGRYALSGSLDSFILWDILQGKKIQTFDHPRAWVNDTTAVAFSPDGKYFASGSKGIKLWDLSTRQEIITFDATLERASIAFSPDGKNLLSGGPSAGSKIPSNMQIYDVATGKEVKDFDPVRTNLVCCIFSRWEICLVRRILQIWRQNRFMGCIKGEAYKNRGIYYR